jgi:formiminotetrahydrofolate cyclodeaminase
MLQNFYEGLTAMSKGHVDAAAGGAFLSLTVANATTLIEKMVANQSWGEDRKTQKDMHSVKEVDMLSAKKIF